MIIFSFGYDPLKCPDCQKEEAVLDIYYYRKQVPLEELYEKAMLKHKASNWRSST